MDNVTFKKILEEVFKNNNYAKNGGYWYKEKNGLIVVIHLQKSNYSNYYDFIMKIYIQGLLGNKYKLDKSLMNDIGDIRIDPLLKHRDILTLDNELSYSERKRKLVELIETDIVPLTERLLYIQNITEMIKSNEIFAFPAVKKSLGVE